MAHGYDEAFAGEDGHLVQGHAGRRERGGMNDHEPVAAVLLDLRPLVRRDSILNGEWMEFELFLAQREVARPGVNHVEPHERVGFLENLTEIGQVRGWL